MGWLCQGEALHPLMWVPRQTPKEKDVENSLIRLHPETCIWDTDHLVWDWKEREWERRKREGEREGEKVKEGGISKSVLTWEFFPVRSWDHKYDSAAWWKSSFLLRSRERQVYNMTGQMANSANTTREDSQRQSQPARHTKSNTFTIHTRILFCLFKPPQKDIWNQIYFCIG